jgi:hypothetical protein
MATPPQADPAAQDKTMAAAQLSTAQAQQATANAIHGAITGAKVLSEFAVVPGASLLLSGQVGSGLAHTAGAFAASYFMGPIGWALVVADSISESVAGKHIWQWVTSPRPPQPPAPNPA